MCVLAASDLLVQRAEAEVAVGRERAHAQLVGEGEHLMVVALGLLDVRRLGARGDLAEQPERPRLVASFLVVPRVHKSTPRSLSRLFWPTGQQICFAEPGDLSRIFLLPEPRGAYLIRRLIQERPGIGNAP